MLLNCGSSDQNCNFEAVLLLYIFYAKRFHSVNFFHKLGTQDTFRNNNFPDTKNILGISKQQTVIESVLSNFTLILVFSFTMLYPIGILD